jgi:hypothetical protein
MAYGRLLTILLFALLFQATSIGGLTGTAHPRTALASRPPTGDFDGDLRVDFSDFLVLAKVYGTAEGDGRYSATCDMDQNGNIDFSDFLAFARVYGQDVQPQMNASFMLHDARGPSEDAYARELGVNTEFIYLDHWAYFEPRDDEWDWEWAATSGSEGIDHLIARIGIMHVLAWNLRSRLPDWVDTKDLDGQIRTEFGEFVTEAVKYLSSSSSPPSLYFVELESNAAAIELGKTNTWLIDWIKWEVELIKAADPDAKVGVALANADMVPNQYVGDETEDDIYMSTTAFIRRMVAAEVDFDVIAFSVSSGVYNKLDSWTDLAAYTNSLLEFDKQLYVYLLAYPAGQSEAATLYYPREGGYSEEWQSEQYVESLRFLLQTEQVIGAAFPMYDYYEPPLNTPYEWGLVSGEQENRDSLVKRRSFDAVKEFWHANYR